MEAAGVELSGVLPACKLLISGIATTAKKDPSPDPFYVHCTKILFALNPTDTQSRPSVSHRFAGNDREKAFSFLRYCKSLFFHFFGTRFAVSITSVLPVIPNIRLNAKYASVNKLLTANLQALYAGFGTLRLRFRKGGKAKHFRLSPAENPKHVRRHRLISISYISWLPCHGTARNAIDQRGRAVT